MGKVQEMEKFITDFSVLPTDEQFKNAQRLFSEDDLVNIEISLQDPETARQFLGECMSGEYMSLVAHFLLASRGVKFIDGQEEGAE